jgi:hypothetical protein
MDPIVEEVPIPLDVDMRYLLHNRSFFGRHARCFVYINTNKKVIEVSRTKPGYRREILENEIELAPFSFVLADGQALSPADDTVMSAQRELHCRFEHRAHNSTIYVYPDEVGYAGRTVVRQRLDQLVAALVQPIVAAPLVANLRQEEVNIRHEEPRHEPEVRAEVVLPENNGESQMPEVERLRQQVGLLEEQLQRLHHNRAVVDGNADENLCVICLDQRKSQLLLPCRHLCVCKNDSLGLATCPVCRSPVEKALEVFL